jgi:hypothetical protein
MAKILIFVFAGVIILITFVVCLLALMNLLRE